MTIPVMAIETTILINNNLENKQTKELKRLTWADILLHFNFQKQQNF